MTDLIYKTEGFISAQIGDKYDRFYCVVDPNAQTLIAFNDEKKAKQVGTIHLSGIQEVAIGSKTYKGKRYNLILLTGAAQNAKDPVMTFNSNRNMLKWLYVLTKIRVNSGDRSFRPISNWQAIPTRVAASKEGWCEREYAAKHSWDRCWFSATTNGIELWSDDKKEKSIENISFNTIGHVAPLPNTYRGRKAVVFVQITGAPAAIGFDFLDPKKGAKMGAFLVDVYNKFCTEHGIQQTGVLALGGNTIDTIRTPTTTVTVTSLGQPIPVTTVPVIPLGASYAGPPITSQPYPVASYPVAQPPGQFISASTFNLDMSDILPPHKINPSWSFEQRLIIREAIRLLGGVPQTGPMQPPAYGVDAPGSYSQPPGSYNQQPGSYNQQPSYTAPPPRSPSPNPPRPLKTSQQGGVAPPY